MQVPSPQPAAWSPSYGPEEDRVGGCSICRFNDASCSGAFERSIDGCEHDWLKLHRDAASHRPGTSDENGRCVEVYGLPDQGSEVTLIDKNDANQLRLDSEVSRKIRRQW